MMELFQAEWCPTSRRVRELLTELDVSYVIRQVPVDRADRDALFAVAGSRVIPALVLEDGTALIDEDAIRDWLGDHVHPPPARADTVRRRKACASPSRNGRAPSEPGRASSTQHTWRSPDDDDPEDQPSGSATTAGPAGLAARARPVRDGRHGHARLGRRSPRPSAPGGCCSPPSSGVNQLAFVAVGDCVASRACCAGCSASSAGASR